jgi:hypothetical protein
MAATPASAILITEAPLAGTNVGSIDTLIGFGNVSDSSVSAEVAFVNYLTGQAYTASSSVKLCDTQGDCAALLYDTDTAGVFALDLAATPGHYLIKTGARSTLSSNHSGTSYSCFAGGSGNDDCTHFVYQNLADLNWGVFDLGAMGFNITNIGKLSHVTQSGGGTTTVPEPATLSLLGFGLLAAGFLRRRSRTAD